MPTLTLLECQYCEEGKCEKVFDKSPLAEIMDEQKLIFDGFMRMEILNHFNQENNQFIPHDIINLCMKFFNLNIKSMFKYKINDVVSLINTFTKNSENFMAYKISKLLLTFHPKRAYFHILYASRLVLWNLFDEAEKECEQAIELEPEHHLARTIYGKVLESRNKKKLALIQFEKAVEIVEYDIDSINDCANLYVKLKDFKNAQKYYQKAVETVPDDVSYKVKYGMFLRNRGQHKDALIQFGEGLKVEPDNPYCMIQSAVTCERLKDFENAHKYYLMAIELDDGNKSRHCSFYAKFLLDIGDFDNAQKYYLQAIEIDPKDATLKYGYGVCLKIMAKYEQALVQFFDGMKMNVHDPDYVVQCGECYGQLRDFENAHEYYLKAIEMGGRKSSKYCNLYGIFLCVYVGDLDQAKKYFMRAMEIAPMNSDPYFRYAFMLRDYVKDYKESEKYYLKALEIFDKSAAINNSYGYLLYLMGDYEKALKYIEIALEINAEDIRSHFYHGLLQKTLGNNNKAEKGFGRAVELSRKLGKGQIENALEQLKVIKKNDAMNVEYYDKLEHIFCDMCNYSSITVESM